MLSPTHLVLFLFLVLLALVVFGPKRLPELGSSVGKAIQEFRKASESSLREVRTVTTTVTDAVHQPVAPSSADVSTPVEAVGDAEPRV